MIFRRKIFLLWIALIGVGTLVFNQFLEKDWSHKENLKRTLCASNPINLPKKKIQKQLGFIHNAELKRWELRILGQDIKYDELINYYLADESNGWGKRTKSTQQFKRLFWQESGLLDFTPTQTPSPIMSLVLPKPYHGYEYKILIVRGTFKNKFFKKYRSYTDPASITYTTPSLLKKLSKKIHSEERSVFWEFQQELNEEKLSSFSNCDAQNILEEDIYFLARMYAKKNLKRELAPEDTYRFLASSNTFKEIRRLGYNRVKFLPVNDLISRDGKHFNDWRSRYAVSKNFYGVDPHFGSPDEFRQMVNKAAEEGIGLISDYVLLHYFGSKGEKDSIRYWPDKPAKSIFGQLPTPWDTSFFDFSNQKVTLFLQDAFMNFHEAFGFVGTRLDAISGSPEHSLLHQPNGETFYIDLMKKVQEHWPRFYINSEVFLEERNFLVRCDESPRICGNDAINNFQLYDWLIDNIHLPAKDMNLAALNSLLEEWIQKHPYTINYLTNHDEAANIRTPGSGQNLESYFDYHKVQDSQKRTPFFYAFTVMMTTDSLSMLHLIYETKGNYNENYILPLERLEPSDLLVKTNKLFDYAEMRPEFLSNSNLIFQDGVARIKRQTKTNQLEGIFNFSPNTINFSPRKNLLYSFSNQREAGSLAPFEFYIQRY